MTASRTFAEDGFTLIEMLATTVILGIIMVPLTGAVVVGLRSSDHTGAVLATSADRQLLSVYLPPDVASATAVSTASDATTGCGPAPGDNVVSLQWQEFSPLTTPTVTTYSAAYRKVQVVAPPDARYELIRYSCENGMGVTSSVVARSLRNATATDSPTGSVTVTLTDTLDEQYSIAAERRLA